MVAMVLIAERSSGGGCITLLLCLFFLFVVVSMLSGARQAMKEFLFRRWW